MELLNWKEECKMINGTYSKKVYQTALNNTKYNNEGKAVISKEDEWADETEWDDVFTEITNNSEEEN